MSCLGNNLGLSLMALPTTHPWSYNCERQKTLNSRNFLDYNTCICTFSLTVGSTIAVFSVIIRWHTTILHVNQYSSLLTALLFALCQTTTLCKISTLGFAPNTNSLSSISPIVSSPVNDVTQARIPELWFS